MSLTDAESKWLKRLQRCLNDCPSGRLGFYTIGDRYVAVYDRSKDVKINALLDSGEAGDFAPAVDLVDAHLGNVFFPSKVHSTSG